MVHQRQRLFFGCEAGDDLAAIHAGLDDLEGHAALDWRGLLGHVDDAHAPFTDLLQKFVGTDLGAGLLKGSLVDGRIRCTIEHHARPDPFLVEQAVGLIVNAKQGFHVPPKFGVDAAGLAQVVGAVRRIGLLDRFQEKLFCGFNVRGHGHALVLVLREQGDETCRRVSAKRRKMFTRRRGLPAAGAAGWHGHKPNGDRRWRVTFAGRRPFLRGSGPQKNGV